MVGMLDALSLKNTKLGLETLELMGFPADHVKLVLNRARSRVGISDDEVVAIMGREPDVFVPSDRDIPRAVNEGKSILDRQAAVGGVGRVPPARGDVRPRRDGCGGGRRDGAAAPVREEGLDGSPRAALTA